MSTFNRFCAKAKKTVKDIGEKAEVFADAAAKAVKIKSLEIKVDEQYEMLGKLVYEDLHTDDNLEEEKLAVIAAIDGLFDQLAILKATDEPQEAPASDEPQSEAPQEESAPTNDSTEEEKDIE